MLTVQANNLIQLPEGIEPNHFLTVNQIAGIVGVSHWVVRGWIRNRGDNGFPAMRLEGVLGTQARELVRWFQSHAQRI